MKIIQVINVRWFNATAWYAFSLSQLLARDGHDVLIVGLEGSPVLEKAGAQGMKTLPLPLNTNNPIRLVHLYRRIGRLLEEFQPDIVNCHRGESFILWGLHRLARKSFKLVRTRGDQRLPKNNVFNRWLHNRVADAVVATNSATANCFLESLGVSSKKLWLVHGGVDTDAFRFDPKGRDRVRKEFRFSDQDTVIGLLGRFDEVKGQKQCIEAVSRLYHVQNHRNIRLMLLGFETATSQHQIEEWIRKWNAGQITVVTGKRKDVAACISAMDIGLVTSLWSEAIARAALEIMACDRPLLSTRVGVMPDILPEQALFPPGDPADIIVLLEKALNQPDFLSEVHWEQQRRVPQLSGQAFLRQSLNLYQSLLP